MKEKWFIVGARLESMLQGNGGKFFVGDSLTYADVLVAHCATWFVEEVRTFLPLRADIE